MSSWILRLDATGTGLRVAVKDLIDVAGVPTTAGCRAAAATAAPAGSDAACLAGTRAAGARIVGKATLNELAFGVTGLNCWWPSPVNPLDPGKVVGGSSSGSAAAIGHGEADVAFGSDTGGSIRIPAACCGIAGLKTTSGRIPLAGVWPLAPTLDTVGPMAADIAGVVAGMALLEPGFAPGREAAAVVGRVRLDASDEVDAALDAALAASGLPVVPAHLEGWDDALTHGDTVLVAETWATDADLWATGALSPEVSARMAPGRLVDRAALDAALAGGRRWATSAATTLASLGPGTVLAMPTLAEAVPAVADATRVSAIRHTLPWNLAGWPALSLPVPMPGGLPASLQLVAGPGGEELLVATAAVVEAACR